MNPINRILVLALFIPFTGSPFFIYGQTTADKAPVKIIYDTDIDLDVDDVGALALLHALQDNGEAEILGVIVNAPTPYGATTVSAVNRYYGHPEIPIGDMPIEEYVYDESFNRRYRGYAVNTPYGNFNIPVFRRFDHGIESRKDIWNGVQLYRKLLAEAADHSVTIAAVGLLTVLEDLMQSGPDRFSDLSGKALISKKVKQLVCMAGASQPAPGKDHFNWGFDGRGDAERISQQWPTTIVIMPFGGSIRTGARLTTETPQNNPVRTCYELFLKKHENKNRSSWDQIACLYAVRGAGDIFEEVNQGKRLDVTFNPVTYRWRDVRPGEVGHLLLKQKAPDATFKTIVEDLMVQPPAKPGLDN